MNSRSEAALHFGTQSSVATRIALDLYRDECWVGTCIVVNHSIVQCHAVQLGPSGRESDEILSAIQSAIETGQTSLQWQGRTFHWRTSQTSGVQALGSLSTFG